MTIGVVGRKCGMTRVFTEDGVSIPVTVIEIEPNRVTQFKNEESDGYRAVQVTVGERRASPCYQGSGRSLRQGERGSRSWRLGIPPRRRGVPGW